MTAAAHDPIPVGAHLTTPRRGYVHHGLYAGGGRVIHYGGLAYGWRARPVQEVSLHEFARGRPVAVQPVSTPTFDGGAAVERARSRLGEARYHLLRNNCEHFVEWCLSGHARSRQVERMLVPIRKLAALLPRPRRIGLVPCGTA